MFIKLKMDSVCLIKTGKIFSKKQKLQNLAIHNSYLLFGVSVFFNIRFNGSNISSALYINFNKNQMNIIELR